MQASATTLFGIVTNVYVLVASRFFQGVSAAIIYTGGLALLVDTVGNDEIGQWMGLVLSFANLGILVSPLLGGLVYGWLGYDAVFCSMLAIVCLDITLRLVMVEKQNASKNMDVGHPNLPQDEDDQSLEEDPLLPSRPKTRDSQVASLAGEREPGTPTTMIFLSQSRVLADISGVLLAQTLITSFDGVLSIFVYRTFGWGSTRAGLIFLTVTVPILAAPLAGMLSDRYGPRWVTISGFTLAACVYAMLALVTHVDFDHVVLLCVLLTVLGFAFSMLITPLATDLALIVEQITEEQPELSGAAGAYGQVFSLLNCGISGGVLLGPSLAGFLYETFG